MAARKPKMVKLDGRTGEGGGQLVRVAIALSALTGTPIEITNVRGNRPGRRGGRGGGLKFQHVSCIETLAHLTNATLTGCTIGSSNFTFTPSLTPRSLPSQPIIVKSSTPSSILLIFQSLLPFLLYASSTADPITLTIQGGTNVSFSPSNEYISQVLLPTLRNLFSVNITSTVESRGWTHGGPPTIGSITFKIHPLPPSTALLPSPTPFPHTPSPISKIDITLIVPTQLIPSFHKSLEFELNLVFPNIPHHTAIEEPSLALGRIYVLLVLHASNGLLFARDYLHQASTKNLSSSVSEMLATKISQRVVDQLDTEVRKGGIVDAHLQDQLIIFQALAQGKTIISGTKEGVSEIGKRKKEEEEEDETDEPFGEGSMHAKTARWVTARLLPGVKWLDNGRICEGVGWKTKGTEDADIENIEKGVKEVGISG